MAGAKEIRTKIASVTSTQKITNAMQMVAAGKMRKAQERMARGKPYGERIRSVVGNVEWRGWLKTLETRHPVVIRREALQELTAAP